MAKTFREALLERVAASRSEAAKSGKPSLRKVADGAGVSYEQLKKVRQREVSSTNIDDAIKVANYFGMTLDEFLGDRTAQVRAEIADLYIQLTEGERDYLRGVADGMRARQRPERPEPGAARSED